MMGGRRYMKKRSSLKTRMWELFPLVVSRITTPVHSPCHQRQTEISIMHTGGMEEGCWARLQ
jgi:hypothetical protein